MSTTASLSFSWVPGTLDRVRFSSNGQIYTVFLRDVRRQNAHSASALYLTGRVILPITAAHLAELKGRLSLGKSPDLAQPRVPHDA